MALNTTLVENFVANIGQENNVLPVDDLGLSKTISKKFAKMLGNVKSTSATIDGNEYVLTGAGACAMLQTLDEGKGLEPSYNGAALDINTDVEKPTVVIGGAFESKATTTQVVDGQEVQIPAASAQIVTGKSISLYDASISDKVAVTLKSDGPIVAEGVVLDNRDGSIAQASNNSNSALKVSGCNPKSVAMKDVKVYGSSSAGANQLYNGLEVWGGTNTKNIVFENCQLLGKFTNNAINVYGCADNSVITVKNCWFDTVSNVLRLSNITNATNVTINFENCVIEHWEGDTATADSKNDWAGFCICQDYTSGVKSGNKCVNTPEAKEQSTANAIANNLFAPTKIKINIKNCRGPKGPIQFAEGETAADYCQTGIATQLCYVIRDCATPYLLPYDPACYPTLNVEYAAAPTVQKASIPAE